MPVAVANYTDDVRIFAGCLTGRKDWPTVAIPGCPVPRLAAALAHSELTAVKFTDDGVRPRYFCRVDARTDPRAVHRLQPRQGAPCWNSPSWSAGCTCCRVQKIEAELAYLNIAIEKTAGPDELEAWGWLMEKVTAHFARSEAESRSAKL